MSNNIKLKNSIGLSYINKSFYLKDKKKLDKIINDILYSLENKKNPLHSFSKNFDLNFKSYDLIKFNKCKSIILIGMGGSSLGAEAIYYFCNDRIKKKFIFFNNLDQSKINKIKKYSDFKKILFIIISKSGNTLETLINSNLFRNKINSKNSIIITWIDYRLTSIDNR